MEDKKDIIGTIQIVWDKGPRKTFDEWFDELENKKSNEEEEEESCD